MIVERTVRANCPIDEVFAYLSDFTTTTEWDPHTVSTVRVSGDGGVGTVYRNTTRFLGRNTELSYRVTDLSPGHSISLYGSKAALSARDTIVTRQVSPGWTEVTYRAEFTFLGAWRLLTPLLAPALRRLADEGAAGMERALAALAGE